jgi:hypothetical protein
MKNVLIILVFLIIGCDKKSPEYLKNKDNSERICAENCKPRQMDYFSDWIGCQCKVSNE